MGLQWLFAGSGPLTAGAGQVGGAACTEYAVGGRPDIQFNVMPLSVDKPGEPLHTYSGFTASVWQCHAEVPRHAGDPLDRSVRTAQDRAELFRASSTARPWSPGSGCCARSTGRNRFATCGISRCFRARRRMTPAGAVGFRPHHRWHRVSLRRHLPDGKRPTVGGRSRLRVRGAGKTAGDRCLGDAADHLRQHQRQQPDDRRAGRGPDIGIVTAGVRHD